MATVIQILTTNYSGETAQITFTPCSGGTINLGNQVLPYNYESENYQGSYSLYFSAFTKTCTFDIPCPTLEPTQTPTNTPTPTSTNIPPTQTPTPTSTDVPPPTNTPTPTSTDVPPTPTPTSTDVPPTPTPTNTPTPTATLNVDCLCPSGYESSDDGSICYRITVSSPTVNDTLQPEAGADNNNYGQFGVKIYNVGDYNISGNSISGNLAFSGFTVVADGSSTTNTELFYSTRMNANNVWVAGDANWPGPNYPDFISFCSTFTLTQSKTYYVGIAGDNDVSIKLNGVELVNPEDGKEYFYRNPRFNIPFEKTHFVNQSIDHGRKGVLGIFDPQDAYYEKILKARIPNSQTIKDGVITMFLTNPRSEKDLKECWNSFTKYIM